MTSETHAVEAFRAGLSDRFRTTITRALLAETLSEAPIGLSRITAPPVETKALPAEDAYALHIHMKPLPALDLWVDGRHAEVSPLGVGDIVLLDLAAAPVAEIPHTMDFTLVQISRRTLDDLAYDRGERFMGGLRPIFGGVNDPILHGLSSALAHQLAIYSPQDRLFIDHMGLAFHAHLVRVYGASATASSRRGGLAPWQRRRACEMMLANMAGDLTVAAVAQACSLSVSYFARAFRRTLGQSPHQWLMRERVRRAKDLLHTTTMSLAEVALTCGFWDQSHLTRVFSKLVGQTPSRWRQLKRD